jgi:hypothetical protein
MAGGAGTGLLAGMLDLDTIAEHRVAKADPGFDIYFGSLWTDFIVG